MVSKLISYMPAYEVKASSKTSFTPLDEKIILATSLNFSPVVRPSKHKSGKSNHQPSGFNIVE